MTIAPPAADPAAPDRIDRVLDGTAREAALDALLGAVMTPSGREEIRAVLGRRLGDAQARLRKKQDLKKAFPTEHSLFSSLIESLTLGKTSEVADELTRILEVAVDTSTSDDLMRRAMGVVLIAASNPAPQEAHAPQGRRLEGPRPAPAAPGPATTARPSGPSRPVRPGPARESPPSYDPHGTFRLPDRAVRFGGPDDKLAAPLFAASDSARGAGPVRVPSALPAPPETDDPDLIRGWLRGLPAFADSLAIRAGLLDLGEPGDLMEIEAEFHTDPKAALRLYKAARPVGDGTADAAWCARLGRDIGRFGVTHERAVEALARLLGDQIRQGPSDRYAPLSRSGAVLVVREELAEAVCGLIDAEAEYLEDGPADTSGPEQNLLGSFSANADLSRGRCLERALSLHVVAGLPMGGAMRQSLTEFRIAQALRANPEAPISFLNDRFDQDAALPLSELCGREPIVRIGLTMPALA